MMCCYHPTTIVAIDDDLNFLDILSQHLGITNCNTFNSPIAAISSLKNHNHFDRLESRILKSNTTTDDVNKDPENLSVQINFKNLHEEIYSDQRFKEVSVIIIDYYMDEMNGIEVCEKLSHHPAKKILLTGGADKERLAIEAFNKGIIHRFINKSDPNFPTQLNNAVTILREAYFRDLTSKLTAHMINNSHILNNSAYVNFVRCLQQQTCANEYYLLDSSGSCVFLDDRGMPAWLIVKSETDFSNYSLMARDLDAPQSITKLLEQRKMMPFFFSENDYNAPVADWKRYLHEANQFPGISGYFYAVESGHLRDNINKTHLIPYKSRAN